MSTKPKFVHILGIRGYNSGRFHPAVHKQTGNDSKAKLSASFMIVRVCTRLSKWARVFVLQKKGGTSSDSSFCFLPSITYFKIDAAMFISFFNYLAKEISSLYISLVKMSRKINIPEVSFSPELLLTGTSYQETLSVLLLSALL